MCEKTKKLGWTARKSLKNYINNLDLINIMDQKERFEKFESDNWFERNKSKLLNLEVLKMLMNI